MTYLYTSDECKAEDHDACEGTKDMPEDPAVCGGGICICSCHVVTAAPVKR